MQSDAHGIARTPKKKKTRVIQIGRSWCKKTQEQLLDIATMCTKPLEGGGVIENPWSRLALAIWVPIIVANAVSHVPPRTSLPTPCTQHHSIETSDSPHRPASLTAHTHSRWTRAHCTHLRSVPTTTPTHCTHSLTALTHRHTQALTCLATVISPSRLRCASVLLLVWPHAESNTTSGECLTIGSETRFSKHCETAPKERAYCVDFQPHRDTRRPQTTNDLKHGPSAKCSVIREYSERMWSEAPRSTNTIREKIKIVDDKRIVERQNCAPTCCVVVVVVKNRVVAKVTERSLPTHTRNHR